MRLKSILCPIDFSDFSVRSYEYSLSLAKYYQARLVALYTVELGKYPFADYAASEADFARFSQALNESGEVHLREFVQKHGWTEVQPETLVTHGNAPDSILSIARTQNIELIVMGTHGRRGFDHVVLGSTTDRVMRRACCPVLAMSKRPNTGANSADEPHRLSRILYCTDFSEHAEGALDYAISLTEEYAAELTLLHVVEHTPFTAKQAELVRSCAERLEGLISAERRKILKVRTVVKIGKAYEEIVQHAADEKIDLITMAVRGADALDRVIFGSTTYRVLQLGPCPVLAVHT